MLKPVSHLIGSRVDETSRFKAMGKLFYFFLFFLTSSVKLNKKAPPHLFSPTSMATALLRPRPSFRPSWPLPPSPHPNNPPVSVAASVKYSPAATL
jgi:hypothetical protein